MSSIRLLKDYPPRGQKGEVISVPFGLGRELVSKGVGAYLVGPAVKAAPATPEAERPRPPETAVKPVVVATAPAPTTPATAPVTPAAQPQTQQAAPPAKAQHAPKAK